MKNIKLSLLFVLGSAFSVTSFAQVGDVFPEMTAEKINDEAIVIPTDIGDKYSLIGLAYSKRSEKDLETWLIPVYNTFIHKPEKEMLFSSFAYDIHVFIVPMFTGVSAAAKGVAKKKAAEGLDPKLHENLLFYKGDLKTYKKALNLGKRDVPYFFVLDKDGKIIYATSGEYTEEKMNEIQDVLSES